MFDDDGSEARHAGQISGTSTRDRVLILAILMFAAGAIALSVVARATQPIDALESPPIAAASGPTPSAEAGGAEPTPRVRPTAAPPPQCPPPIASPWEAHPCEFRGEISQQFEFLCPAGGVPGPIWGDAVYTDDSSVCGAAVHAGVITREAGGTAVITIATGRAGYPGVSRNGIESESWGRWGGSFAVVGFDEPRVLGCSVSLIGIEDAWAMTACAYRGSSGMAVTYTCPEGGSPMAVWGVGPYTDDSSVCTAAVHTGLFTAARGGIARILIRPGQDSYPGSTEHGVTTEAWDEWPGSFEVAVP